MKDKWEDIKRIVKHKNPDFRPIRAFTVNSDGTTSLIEGENIYIEIDDDRGLLIPLCERRENEGISIRSLPQEEINKDSFKPNEKGMLVSSPVKSSSVVIRNGGANLIYVSPEMHTGQVIMPPPEKAE